MIFAQIKNGLIVNTIVLNQESDLDLFLCDPITKDPFDFVVRIDYCYPRPGIGWSFNELYFLPPIQQNINETL